ncbi:hypothetical protein MKW98_017272 [Papaver atlanticum]|uniref:Uncharacterized protein n=1 Tax=Papaver atlanticum TaxID=357466 RepID=A0AAD4X8S4_9MAGN|nr:hypothetical protein MKW98_017272 [Papaver atlanticum]
MDIFSGSTALILLKSASKARDKSRFRILPLSTRSSNVPDSTSSRNYNVEDGEERYGIHFRKLSCTRWNKLSSFLCSFVYRKCNAIDHQLQIWWLIIQE